MHITGHTATGRLLGAQLVGRLGAEIAKRIDIVAIACQHGLTVDGLSDLDLSYTPPLGSPWDALQLAAWAANRAACQGLFLPNTGGPSAAERSG